MKRNLLTILAVTALSAPVAVLAAGAGAMGHANAGMGGTAMTHHSKLPSFKKADRNGDGYVSIKEAEEAGVPKSIAKKEDINHDGKLTKVDWAIVKMDMRTQKQKASKSG